MFHFEGYTLDVERGCLRTADREIDLRPKSFDVLRYLLENGGRLVTKDEVMRAIWPNVIVTDESLAQCISEVRHAIGDSRQTIIKTVPRRGYRFAAPVSQREADAGSAAAAGESLQGSSYSAAKPAPALLDRPSIAVLPFVNLKGEEQQNYFSDGISSEIITELSRFSDLFVIARSSTFQYKGKTVDIRQIGRELGVRYVLEGSIRRDDDRIRISAELIDAVTGAHRWAERYDRELRDVFAVQDEVVRTIVAILAVQVIRAEAERTLLKPPATWEAYDYYLRGAEAFATGLSQLPTAALYEARQFLERSIAIDPGYARALAVLGRTYAYAYVEPRDADYLNPAALERANTLARTAVRLDPNLPQARALLGAVLMFSSRHEEALVEYERGFALNPNFIDYGFGLCLVFAGQPAKAIEMMQASMRLDPHRNSTRLAYMGNAHYMLGRYAEAVPPLRESALQMPNLRITHLWLAAAYAQLGQLVEARAAAADVLRIEPGFTIDRWKRTAVYKRPEDAEHLFDGLRKAALPES